MLSTQIGAQERTKCTGQGLRNIQQTLKEHQVDSKLIAIITIPFYQFINAKHNLYWRNYTWLKGFEEKLEHIDWENADCGSKTEALMSLLINCDFNDDRFFIYCKRYIKQRAGSNTNRNRQLIAYAECEKLILEDTYHEFPSYNHRLKNISDKLIDWIKKETNAILLQENVACDFYKI
ncbi:MAG: hypothetical protein ACXVB0_22735, partial [Mucilaginibacter sp.]